MPYGAPPRARAHSTRQQAPHNTFCDVVEAAWKLANELQLRAPGRRIKSTTTEKRRSGAEIHLATDEVADLGTLGG